MGGKIANRKREETIYSSANLLAISVHKGIFLVYWTRSLPIVSNLTTTGLVKDIQEIQNGLVGRAGFILKKGNMHTDSMKHRGRHYGHHLHRLLVACKQLNERLVLS